MLQCPVQTSISFALLSLSWKLGSLDLSSITPSIPFPISPSLSLWLHWHSLYTSSNWVSIHPYSLVVQITTLFWVTSFIKHFSLIQYFWRNMEAELTPTTSSSNSKTDAPLAFIPSSISVSNFLILSFTRHFTHLYFLPLLHSYHPSSPPPQASYCYHKVMVRESSSCTSQCINI